MRTIAIFVATTGGPAGIERLTPEFAPQSMVCLRRGSDILPISDDYDDFVKRGSGVIEREFGPFDTASFRMDVSESIGAGKSWQLGVFAAHAVAASSELILAGSDATPDLVVWLTGEVDYDLGVGSVGHVPEKIAASQEFFTKWQQAGVPVLALVPLGKNLAEVIQATLPEGVAVKGISSAPEILTELGLVQKTKSSAPKDKKKSNRIGAVFLALTVLVLAGWAIGADKLSGMLDNFKTPPAHQIITKKPAERELPILPKPPKAMPIPVAAPSLHVYELRPPENATCAKVHFGRVEAEAVKINTAEEVTLASSHNKSLCGLNFVFDLGETAQFVAVELGIESGAFVRGSSKPSVLSGIKKAKGKQAWSLDVPRRLAEPLHYALTVIIGKQPTAAEISWFKKQNDGKKAAQALFKKGFVVLTWSHKISP